jgi:hypothetical protein
VSELNKNASGPYFTTNQYGESILVWTEAQDGDRGHIIKYATLDEMGHTFRTIHAIPSSSGCRAHDESMSKLAFKADGTMLAVFSKRTPTKKNRFAGALYYTQSFDEGANWTAAQYLHVGDTTHGLSRSFFDLTRLPDGEIGAIWLDSRLTKKRGDGSSLFFAKTSEKKGFLTDQVIGRGTCECCRTELYTSAEGHIHVAYRNIWQDSIRDMAHLVSFDNGKTFSTPKRISADDWVINGCPHTGPSLGVNQAKLHATWFTMGGAQGLYYAYSDDIGNSFKPRQLLTKKGKHPQLLALKDGKMVFVWEESNRTPVAAHHEHGSPQAVKVANTIQTTTSYIKAQIWQNGHPLMEYWVSEANKIAEYPVLTELKSGNIGIAWVQEIGEEGYGIFYKKIKI